MSARKPFAIYAITTHGIGIATRLLEKLPGADLFVSEKLLSKELMLKPDGTVALAEVPPVVEFPHAAATIAIAPTKAKVERRLILCKESPLLM